jgi:16S rRNA (guanine527-N7)-methyltransferase
MVITEQINIYKQELLQWNNAINLIAKSTEQDADKRHINQSLWLGDVIASAYNDDQGLNIVDIGSGAGLPAMIMAIKHSDFRYQLVEANTKKCAFLYHIKVKLGLDNVSIHNTRIEDFRCDEQNSIMVARACANLSKLLDYAKLLNITSCYFLKGESIEDEVSMAKTNHSFHYELVYSEIYATFICKVLFS